MLLTELINAACACWHLGHVPPRPSSPLNYKSKPVSQVNSVNHGQRHQADEILLTFELDVDMLVVLQLLADNSLHVDMDVPMQPDISDCAHLPKIVLVIPVAHCLAKPGNRLLAITTVNHEHFIPHVHLHVQDQKSNETACLYLH